MINLIDSQFRRKCRSIFSLTDHFTTLTMVMGGRGAKKDRSVVLAIAGELAGINIATDLPESSLLVYPKILSVAWFTLSILPRLSIVYDRVRCRVENRSHALFAFSQSIHCFSLSRYVCYKLQ